MDTEIYCVPLYGHRTRTQRPDCSSREFTLTSVTTYSPREPRTTVSSRNNALRTESETSDKPIIHRCLTGSPVTDTHASPLDHTHRPIIHGSVKRNSPRLRHGPWTMDSTTPTLTHNHTPADTACVAGGCASAGPLAV